MIPSRSPRCLELFAGCGGLALGAEAAGFGHVALLERDRAACRTLRRNRPGWQVLEADVRSRDWRSFEGVDVVSGGPPCQPFSVGGKAKGHVDDRDMWPEALRALSETGPSGFVFENVQGLLRPAFAGYLGWIREALAKPGIRREPGECHAVHRARLQADRGPVEYRVATVAVDAADLGVAQRRRRVLFLGVRADVADEAPTLPATHSRERLVFDQWIDGSYWARVGLRRPARGPDAAVRPLVEALARSGRVPPSLPWRTVRECLAGLGEPDGRDAHDGRGGARTYPGHTGSPLDWPSKAIKAGDHGVPGGENMLVRDDGTVRYYTAREAATVQDFPREWSFVDPWGTSLRQIGNAVPVTVAAAAFGALAEALRFVPVKAHVSLARPAAVG